jgi:hypothetical protein
MTTASALATEVAKILQGHHKSGELCTACKHLVEKMKKLTLGEVQSFAQQLTLEMKR